MLIQDRGDLEPAAILEVIGLEVDRPHVIAVRRAQRGLPGGVAAALTAPARRRPQALFPPQALGFLWLTAHRAARVSARPRRYPHPGWALA